MPVGHDSTAIGTSSAHVAESRGRVRRSRPSDATPLVCAVAYDGLCTFEFGLVVEVFGLPRPELERWYRFRTVAAEPGPLRAVGGVTVTASHGLASLRQADIVVLPGWRGADAPVPPALARALRTAHARGARVVSICSGAFVLAACGLLDGRRATTHWRHADALRSIRPAIDVDPDVLFVDHGDVATSAGSAAGLDLCLHLVRRDFGAETANAVARRLVLPALREGGQRQFLPRPVPRERGDPIAALLDHVRARLDEPWPLERLAREAGTSVRTLSRRLREATGQGAGAWLVEARVARAAELLEGGTSLADVADACGFGSQESLRRHFRRRRGVSPSRYRAMFGRTGV